MSVEYERGRLRYVRVDGVEVLRQIYLAVRDRHWNTIPARIVGERIDSTPDGFLIELDVEHRADDLDFRWKGSFRGWQDRIEAEFDGEAHSTFLRNRIGWCVLHPTRECIGKPCTVHHPDGSVHVAQFPEDVSPHQPFLDIETMTWNPGSGLHARLTFEGDVFETEDQRNWTDDSFKTYSTPLRLPFPVQMNPGDRIRQRAVLSLSYRTTVRVLQTTTSFPQIALLGEGVGQAVSLHPLLNRNSVEAAVRVRTSADFEAAKQSASGHTVARWIVYDADKPATTPETIALARNILGVAAPIGGGSDTSFVQLNRNRDVAAAADFIAFSANPQSHATDERTIVENLPGIGAAIRSARALAGGKPVVLSPLTLKRRFNPHARDVAEAADGREHEPFGAAWLVGAVKYAAEAGVESITLASNAALDEILAFGADSVRATESSNPLEAVALALERGASRLVLIANLTDSVREIEFEDRVLSLAPYAVVKA